LCVWDCGDGVGDGGGEGGVEGGVVDVGLFDYYGFLGGCVLFGCFFVLLLWYGDGVVGWVFGFFVDVWLCLFELGEVDIGYCSG